MFGAGKQNGKTRPVRKAGRSKSGPIAKAASGAGDVTFFTYVRQALSPSRRSFGERLALFSALFTGLAGGQASALSPKQAAPRAAEPDLASLLDLGVWESAAYNPEPVETLRGLFERAQIEQAQKGEAQAFSPAYRDAVPVFPKPPLLAGFSAIVHDWSAIASVEAPHQDWPLARIFGGLRAAFDVHPAAQSQARHAQILAQFALGAPENYPIEIVFAGASSGLAAFVPMSPAFYGGAGAQWGPASLHAVTGSYAARAIASSAAAIDEGFAEEPSWSSWSGAELRFDFAYGIWTVKPQASPKAREWSKRPASGMRRGGLEAIEIATSPYGLRSGDAPVSVGFFDAVRASFETGEVAISALKDGAAIARFGWN